MPTIWRLWQPLSKYPEKNDVDQFLFWGSITSSDSSKLILTNGFSSIIRKTWFITSLFSTPNQPEIVINGSFGFMGLTGTYGSATAGTGAEVAASTNPLMSSQANVGTFPQSS